MRDVSAPLDMTVLALETSCDETAVAILRGRDRHSGPPIGRTRPAASSELLASEVASQIAAHAKYGGIVPEIASRNHLVYAPQLLERAVRDAKIDMPEVDAFAATSGPGLASSLMIGASVWAFVWVLAQRAWIWADTPIGQQRMETPDRVTLLGLVEAQNG